VLQDFQDKVAVVTGAAGGIGRALARGFADEGMRVVAGDIDLAGAESTAQGLGAAARALAVDVADADSVAAFADACFDAFGQVDLLVNNAGVFQGGLSWERSVEDWDWTLGVNVYGIIHAIRSFVPRMIAQDTEGHIVNTASVAAFVAGPSSSPYIVSKCAALSLSECLALDLKSTGAKIGASVLTPSAFDTAIAETARVRPARFQRDDTPDGKGTAQALAAIVGKGRAPADVVAPVLDALRNGDFLIPTLPSFAAQIRNRYDALLERRLPDLIEVD
jgi:NAD(P)-dependent dehydrogenase (short-subunit alcohol dehydrogenase family)